MRLRPQDPDRLAARRAVRAAIAVPVALAIALYVFDDRTGAGFTLFGVTGLLVSSDFAGTPRKRALAYLYTGIAGSIALTIGWAASFNAISAVIVTVIIGFVLTFLGLIRGSVSIGMASVLMVFVLAVCLDGSSGSLGDYLLGWWIAVVVSTATALVILPRKRRGTQRIGLAEAFHAAARAAEAAWIHPDGTRDEAALAHFVSEFDDAVDRLDVHSSGQSLRASGLSERDATLNVLANTITGIRLLVDEAHEAGRPDEVFTSPERQRLAHAIVHSLDSLSTAMLDPTILPSAMRLDRAREAVRDGVEEWVLTASEAGTPPEEVSRRIASLHQLRIFALLVEQMVGMARVANGGGLEDLEVGPPVPRRSLRMQLSAQFTLTSPWMRNAIRSAIGLGLGVLVLQVTGVGHGFWVLLGVISVLRLDAVGTRQYALRAVLGSFIGVAVGLIVITVFVTSPAVLWILLPILTLIGTWATGAVNYPSGQVAFSAMVLVALGILQWPPKVQDGITRVEDIAMGAGVALLVGFLFWPRGAAGYLRERIVDALRAAGTYLSTTLRAFADQGLQSQMARDRKASVAAVYRAFETYDTAVNQRGPHEDVEEWEPSMTLAHLISSVGHIMSAFAIEEPIARTHPHLAPAIETARTAVDEQWEALCAQVDPKDDDAPPLPAVPDLPYPTLSPITSTKDAHALVIAVWLTDWVTHLSRLAHMVVPAPEVSTPSDSPLSTGQTNGVLSNEGPS